MRFLIVDDDPLSRDLLRYNLSDYGTCYEVPSGLLAVEAYKSSLAEGQPFDVIFLDLMMPIQDGHETLAEFRIVEETCNVPPAEAVKVVIVTAQCDASNMAKSFQGGCAGLIIKPVTKNAVNEELIKLGLCETPETT